MAGVIAVDVLVGEYREQSDSRWLAIAYLAAQMSEGDVTAAAAALLRDGGASEAHRQAANELAGVLELGLCRG